MLRLALLLFIISLLAGVFGFTGIAGVSASIAQIFSLCFWLCAF